jgi:hypothetical protein
VYALVSQKNLEGVDALAQVRIDPRLERGRGQNASHHRPGHAGSDDVLPGKIQTGDWGSGPQALGEEPARAHFEAVDRPLLMNLEVVSGVDNSRATTIGAATG